MTAERKLAAIMFTDMVGYSALAQRHEAHPSGLGLSDSAPIPIHP